MARRRPVVDLTWTFQASWKFDIAARNADYLHDHYGELAAFAERHRDRFRQEHIRVPESLSYAFAVAEFDPDPAERARARPHLDAERERRAHDPREVLR